MRLKYVKASRANCILCEIAEKIKLMLRPYSLARNISYNLSSYYYIFILVFFFFVKLVSATHFLGSAG